MKISPVNKCPQRIWAWWTQDLLEEIDLYTWDHEKHLVKQVLQWAQLMEKCNFMGEKIELILGNIAKSTFF